jgi:hypothetical protein
MTISMLRPGILVALHTALRGGVTYDRIDLDSETNGDGESVVRWETTRRIDDPEEHARATKVRSQAMSSIRRVCSPTAFGLLCPEDREEQLDAAITDARRLVSLFNAEARSSQVSVYVLKGRVAKTDEEAARAIAAEVESLLAEMQQGIRGADAKAIRDAANRARQVGAVLASEQATKVGMAVETARAAAKQIVKRIEKGAENASTVLAELSGATAAIETARIAFLDLDPVVDTGDALPATDARDLEV